jgi:hypothetical protein
LGEAADGLPAEGPDQPAVLGGQRIAAEQVLGVRGAAGVRSAAGPRPAAGGEAVHQVGEAFEDAVEPAPERAGEGEEMGLAVETAADDDAQRVDDDRDPTGEFGGVGFGRRWECRFHG